MHPESHSREPASARLIRRSAARLSRIPRRALLGGIATIFVAASLVSCLYVVGNGEQAAVRRFGRLVAAPAGPGLHAKLPWGVDMVTRIRTSQVYRLGVNGDSGPVLFFITGDENIIAMQLSAQYRVVRPEDYLFRVEDPRQAIVQVIRAALAEATATLPVDDLLTFGKAGIQNRVRQAAQAAADRYRLGIVLVSVNLQSVDPPVEAAEAFRGVSDARAQAARAISDAQSLRERELSLARGEAEGVLKEADSQAAARLALARGATDRFLNLLDRERSTTGLTRSELYAQTVRRVLSRVRLILLPPGEKPRIDVNLSIPPKSSTQ